MNWLTDRQRQYLEMACQAAGLALQKHPDTTILCGGSRSGGKLFFKWAYEAAIENPMLMNVLTEEGMKLRKKILGDL